jgi:hypothetical protein
MFWTNASWASFWEHEALEILCNVKTQWISMLSFAK